MIIPSIDLMNGKAVQLRQGKEKVIERDDVLDLAEKFKKYGEIAVIDLDAALGKGNNTPLIKEICKRAACRVGGGIRTIEKANELLAAGAKKIIIGTKATPEFLKQLPKERIIVAVDTKDGKVVDNGWTNKTTKTPEEVITQLEKYCSEFLFTNVEREGLMEGCDFKIVSRLLKATKNKLTVAGGITTVEEIKKLEEQNINSQLGMALYTEKITLDDAFISVLDFEKSKGLIPTIIQDEEGKVLMLAFSSKESLQKTFNSGRATYYSRSRKKLWTKGETSNNFQEVISVRYDCDRDALLFTVKQQNVACHLSKYSCFGDKEFSLEELYSVIEERIANPTNNFYNSYTSKIAANEELIKEKIKEESDEVINYKDRDNLIWEIADLTYFVMVLMAKNKVSLTDVKNELWRRRK